MTEKEDEEGVTVLKEDGDKSAREAGRGGGGGGDTQVQRGAAPALHISREKGSFLRPPHVRNFVKEGYFFVPCYEVWGGGGGNRLTIHKIYAALTPSDSRSDLASEFAA